MARQASERDSKGSYDCEPCGNRRFRPRAALKQLGVRRVFGLCSDQTNSIFCALAMEEIDIIGTRHETGAIHMAEGWARATGEPGVAVIGGGPGFVNGVTGIGVAQYAAVPVIVIAGQPPLHTRERNGHQILYQADIVRSLTKWSQEVTHPDIVAEFVMRAFRIATSGKPGPVCLSIPTNVLEGALNPSAAPYKVQPLRGGRYPGGAQRVPSLRPSTSESGNPAHDDHRRVGVAWHRQRDAGWSGQADWAYRLSRSRSRAE